MKTTKTNTSTETELVSKYKATCIACGNSWRDKRRDSIIEKKLQKDPDYLKSYKCRNCKRLEREMKYDQFKKSIKQEAVPEPVGKPEEDINLNVNITLTREDLKQFIPQPVGRYINRNISGVKDINLLKFHYDSDDPLMKNVLLIGETGTGKSLLARHFCNLHQIPYYRVVMNAGTTPEDIIGQWVMHKDGKFQFQYQVLVLFMQYGGVFVFDEINAGQKELLHILNSVTDFERIVTVTQHKGEVIRACKNFMVISCMNPPQEYDLSEMSKSLKDRFAPYYFDYDIKVDRKVLGKEEKNLIEFAKTIRLARANGEIETPLSTRALLQFKTIRDSLGYDVAKEMLINKFSNGEKNVVKTQMELNLEKSSIVNDTDADAKGDGQ